MTNDLPHSPADVLRRALIALGVGTDPADAGEWPAYASSEPNAPDDCLTVYDTTNVAEGRTMPDGEVQEHLGFQVRVRSRTHVVGWFKANAVRQALQSLYQLRVTLDTTQYLIPCVAGIGGVLALGRNSPTSARTLFTVNATAVVWNAGNTTNYLLDSLGNVLTDHLGNRLLGVT